MVCLIIPTIVSKRFTPFVQVLQAKRDYLLVLSAVLSNVSDAVPSPLPTSRVMFMASFRERFSSSASTPRPPCYVVDLKYSLVFKVDDICL